MMPSAGIADAAEALTGRRCHMTGAIRLLEGARCAGPALTIRLTRDPSAPAMTLGIDVVRILRSAERGAVLVIALEDDYAAFGATLALLAHARGLAGVVVDGCVRDRAELRRIALPVFARGTVAGSAGGHFRLAAANEPLVCGGIAIEPGDLVVGDEDGIAVAPRARQEEILAAAARLQEEEAAVIRMLGL